MFLKTSGVDFTVVRNAVSDFRGKKFFQAFRAPPTELQVCSAGSVDRVVVAMVSAPFGCGFTEGVKQGKTAEGIPARVRMDPQGHRELLLTNYE